MKTDARVKYTKMVLKKALLELMQHKPVNKITVKAIPIFLFQNYIPGIIQCHNGRRIVERNGIEIINVLTIRQVH